MILCLSSVREKGTSGEETSSLGLVHSHEWYIHLFDTALFSIYFTVGVIYTVVVIYELFFKEFILATWPQ